MNEVNRLNQDGIRRVNEDKAMIQILHILTNPKFVDAGLVERLFRDISVFTVLISTIIRKEV